MRCYADGGGQGRQASGEIARHTESRGRLRDVHGKRRDDGKTTNPMPPRPIPDFSPSTTSLPFPQTFMRSAPGSSGGFVKTASTSVRRAKPSASVAPAASNSMCNTDDILELAFQGNVAIHCEHAMCVARTVNNGLNNGLHAHSRARSYTQQAPGNQHAKGKIGGTCS